ncbi:hypothetical protein Zmor_008542 [Zophobas morio]|uniref:Uncharacterized protein n=1 Tax=Zophobas morio TaxID=2755281 RepID=A0AA38IWP9_9CUCU|nr:hypothetical protein Zmor_008542 [Zophobas morio]
MGNGIVLRLIGNVTRFMTALPFYHTTLVPIRLLFHNLLHNSIKLTCLSHSSPVNRVTTGIGLCQRSALPEWYLKRFPFRVLQSRDAVAANRGPRRRCVFGGAYRRDRRTLVSCKKSDPGVS